MSEEFREPDLTEVEAALASLAPAPGALSRDQLLFRAGQASVRRGWGWPCVTGLMTCAAAALAALQMGRPTPQGVQETHYVRIELPPSPPAADSRSPAEDRPLVASTAMPRPQTSYFTLRDQVLRWGLDALPNVPASAAVEPPLTLNQLLGEPPPGPEVPSWLDRLLKRGEPL